ncbi:MAG: hypothetical protein KDD61_14105 [Bdellovibrionales bacterium]|nr:hypothetical protein [Bdellovibrionales bacterium]
MTARVLYLISTLCLVFLFQNCDGVNFEDTQSELVAKNEITTPGDENPPSGDQETDGNNTPGSKDDSDKEEESTTTDNDSDRDKDSDDEKKGHPTDKDDSRGHHADNEHGGRCDDHRSGGLKDKKNGREEDRERNDFQGEYLCILDGPGDSVKLALKESNLRGDQSTPESVCVSKAGCEQIVNSAFYVKRAKRSGACNGRNPHVIHLSDEELIHLVSQ